MTIEEQILALYQRATIYRPLGQYLYSITDIRTPLKYAGGYAATICTGGKLTVQVNVDKLGDQSNDAVGTVLVHEALHIRRQHLHPRHKGKIEPYWTLAIEAWINERLRRKDAQELNLITLDLVSKVAGIDIPRDADEETIYQLLLEHRPPSQPWPFPIPCCVHLDQVDPADAVEIEIASLDVRNASGGGQGDIPEELTGSFSGVLTRGSGLGRRGRAFDGVYQCPLLLRVLEALSGSVRSSHYMRGWRRESKQPWAMGRTREYRARVLVALDVSGSIPDRAYKLAARLANGLTLARASCEYVAFDTHLQGHPKPYAPKSYVTGGGTDFGPVFQAARGYDALVMVTDGDGGQYPLPACPVVWVWVGVPRKWRLRPQDRELDLTQVTT